MIGMWLGIDDTDSLDGGCTTLVFHDLLNALPANMASHGLLDCGHSLHEEPEVTPHCQLKYTLMNP